MNIKELCVFWKISWNYLLFMNKSLQIQTMVVGQFLKWGEKWFSRTGDNRGSKRGHEEDQEGHTHLFMFCGMLITKIT